MSAVLSPKRRVPVPRFAVSARAVELALLTVPLNHSEEFVVVNVVSAPRVVAFTWALYSCAPEVDTFALISAPPLTNNADNGLVPPTAPLKTTFPDTVRPEALAPLAAFTVDENVTAALLLWLIPLIVESITFAPISTGPV